MAIFFFFSDNYLFHHFHSDDVVSKEKSFHSHKEYENCLQAINSTIYSENNLFTKTWFRFFLSALETIFALNSEVVFTSPLIDFYAWFSML